MQSTVFDWGRTRAYFSLGSTIAKQSVEGKPDDTEFTSAEWWVGLNVDYNWFTTLRDRSATPCVRPERLQAEVDRAEDQIKDNIKNVLYGGKNKGELMRSSEVANVAARYMTSSFLQIAQSFEQHCKEGEVFQDERAAISALRTIAASMDAEVKRFPSDPSAIDATLTTK